MPGTIHTTEDQQPSPSGLEAAGAAVAPVPTEITVTIPGPPAPAPPRAPVVPEVPKPVPSRILPIVFGAVLAVGLGLSLTLESSGVRVERARVAATQVGVAADVGGRVARWEVPEGAAVTAGQPVLALDEAELRAELALATADLAIARAGEATNRAGEQAAAAGQRARMGQARALLAGAKAQRTNAVIKTADARQGLARRRQAFNQGAISADQLSDAESNVSTALGALSLAESQVLAAEQALAMAGTDSTTRTSHQGIEAQDARIRRAEAAVTLANLHLAAAVVKAPVAGRLARRLVAAGERIAAGQALATLVDGGKRWVEVPVPQIDWPKVAVGQQARISVDAWPAKTFLGRVTDVGSVAGAQAGGLAPGAPPDPLLPPAVLVRVELDDAAAELVPGMSASVLISR